MNNTLRARTDTIELLESRRLFSTITVTPVEVVAGIAPTQAVFTATLDAPAASPIKLSYSTLNGSAKAGLDYRATASHVVIPAGATSATFSVNVLSSTVTEPDRAFFVRLSAGPGNDLASKKTSATIIESSTPPTVTVSDATVKVGLGAHRVTIASFFVGLTNRTASPVTVHYLTQGVTAVPGINYFPGNGYVVIPPFRTGGNIKIKIVGTAMVSPDKVFDVNITGATNGQVPPGTFSRVVITDDVTGGIVRPNLTISNATAVRGADAVFNLTLSAPSANDVSVHYFTTPGTASEAQFAQTNGILTIPAGQTTATISVPTAVDSNVNADGQFRLVLSAPANAQIVGNNAIGTILFYPSITINDAVVDEANAAPLKPVTFFATLNAPSSLPVTFTYNTADGGSTDSGVFENATAGTDYTASSGTLTFQPGQTSLAFTVPVLADPFAFGDQIFAVNISSPVNGIIARATATGTIQNLAEVVGVPLVTVEDASAMVHSAQNGVINFTVSLESASTLPVSVQYTTADDTAVAGIDYTAQTGTVTFDPGQTNKLVSIPIFGNATITTILDFTLTLSNPVNATLDNAVATGTVTELGVGQ